MLGLLAIILLTMALATWKRDITGSTMVPATADRDGRSAISAGDRPQADSAHERHQSVTNPGAVNVSSALIGGARKNVQDIGPDPAIDLVLVEDKIPEPVSHAAALGLAPFLNCIPEPDLKHYGFTSSKELADCSLATAFRVYTITPDKILGFDGNAKLSSLISATELWFFPITSGGQYRALLTVANVNGKWDAVAIGSSGLARDLSKVVAVWPASEGYDYKFVRVYQARSDFAIIHGNGATNLVPLTSASMMLALTRSPEADFKLYDYMDIMPRLIAVVRRSLGK